MTGNETTAVALAKLGLYVFKVRVDADGTKTPMHPKGHLDGTLDLGLISDWFIESPNARIGVDMGRSGLVALDVDVKNGKDGWTSLEKEWLDVPSTFGYDTPSGGRHLIYAAPENKHLAPSTNYRGMVGVDVRGGSSWVLWNGGVPASRDEFAPAPEWLCDERTTKKAGEFEGDVKEWFDGLPEGEPNALVRKAIERINPDMSHAEMVAATYEAIRLGAEFNSGVPVLIEALEEAWMSRDPGGHTTPEDRWEWKFQESLNSGIQKYGDAISLVKELPEYSLATLPAGIPDRLVVGEPGGREVFRDLLRALQEATDDDLYVTSVLWNCPRTRDISREWGLTFVHDRVTSARIKPEPIRENPTLPDSEPAAVVAKNTAKGDFLSPEEAEIVKNTRTFIDCYLAASNQKGFSVLAYDIPGAWTALSMAVGPRAITKFNGVGVNLWFIEMGNTGTGKSVSQAFLSGVLDTVLLDGEGNYNLGANSSPAGIHEELLIRDGKASMIHHDEAASFFSDLTNSEWFKSLEHHFSKFYDGIVEPSNKVRLDKNLRGKKASTSFNLNMSATPEKLLKLVTLDMFESGFLSRVNWTWATPRPENSERYTMAPSEIDAKVKTHPAVYGLAADLASVSVATNHGTIVDGTSGAWARLSEANEQFHAYAKTRERYDILQGPLTRLSETMVKCAALLALYRGENVFTLHDVLVSIRYCVEWLNQFVLVVSQASESAFSRDANEIEVYIRAEGGSVSEAKLMNRFRAMVRNSPKELSDRVDFLRMSGRINRIEADRKVTYVLNG